jgi:hypothetical protein
VLEETCKAVQCKGIDSMIVESASIQTDCQVEIYVIKCCLLVLLSLHYALLLNLCSSLAFNVVKYLQLLSSRTNTLPCQHKSSLVPVQLSAALRQFKAAGRVQLAVGGFIFVLWLVGLFALEREQLLLG